MRSLKSASFALALILVACSSNDAPADPPEAGTGGEAGASGAASSGAGASGADGAASGISVAGVSGAASGSDGGPDLGDAGPDDATVPSLDEDRPLSSLNGNELKFLCAELAELADSIANEQDAARLSCVLLASVFAGSGASFDVAACEAEVDQCLISDEGWISTMRCEADAFQRAVLGCQVSIAQYRECVVASAELLAGWIDTFSCQSFAMAGAQPPSGDSSSVAECSPVMAACPALFENSTGGPAPNGCDDTCIDAKDRFCDDGGPGSLTKLCPLGTDCSDCGPR